MCVFVFISERAVHRCTCVVAVGVVCTGPEFVTTPYTFPNMLGMKSSSPHPVHFSIVGSRVSGGAAGSEVIGLVSVGLVLGVLCMR